jgi:Tol biopolymer transport system component
MNAILNDNPAPISKNKNLIPPAMERIVLDCLAKKPEERFQAAHDLQLALGVISDITESGSPTVLRKSRFLPAMLIAIIVIALILSYFAGKHIGFQIPSSKELVISQPTYHRLTFRRGALDSARFMPDGHGVVYSASWQGNPSEIFMGFLENPESRSLSFNAKLLSISSTREMALLVRHRMSQNNDIGAFGTLARVPVSGGAPKELTEDIVYADWSSDGKKLAVVRYQNHTFRLEFPLGKILYETSHVIRDIRVSPKNDAVAFVEIDEKDVTIVTIDGTKNRKVLSRGWWYVQGLAWTASGNEVWFAAAKRTLFPKEIYAVSLLGKNRLILRTANTIYLHDISRDNRVLMTLTDEKGGISLFSPDGAERDLAWFDYSAAMDLSKDGKTVLINEISEATGTTEHVAYIRSLDGSPAIRLGEGIPTEFSPDGKWILAVSGQKQLTLIPTGAGEPTDVSKKEFYYRGAYWLPDGKHIVFEGKENNLPFRIYVQDLSEGKVRAVTPEYTRIGIEWTNTHPVSPDFKIIVVSRSDGKYWLYPIEPGGPKQHPIPGLRTNEDIVLRWDAGGNELYVAVISGYRQKIYLLNPWTGKKSLWKELDPADPAGIVLTWPPQITADGKSYVYSYIRNQSDLYLVEGLK